MSKTPESSNSKRVITTADIVEEVRKMNNSNWTPELEKQFIHDVNKMILEWKPIGVLLVGMKYNLSPEGVAAKMREIHARGMVELRAKWAAFKAGPLAQSCEQTVQLVP